MEVLPLFVYGTLRNSQRNYYLLRGKTLSEVPATINNAMLYALRSYPMLMQGDGTVYGELMTLNPTLYVELMHQLDEFEGNTPQDNYLFRRVKQTVTLQHQEQILAWLYVGNPQYLSTVPHSLIPHGDWSRYIQERANA
jgi:gamma-glutamylcyclotransferase (GGCT)/AIG2-like uncharacterized protein YtfP